MLNFGPVPHVSDEQIRQMAREAERENDSLPSVVRKPRGVYFRRAAIRLGVVPLSDLSVEELTWYLGVVVLGRVGGI